MNESKEVLEATIKGLEEKMGQLNMDLKAKQKELEDINKPEMTNEMYDTLEECITQGIDEACGNLTHDDMDVDFGMEYDGKVYLESINVSRPDEMTDRVLDEINNKFKIIKTL
jgi:hypothetical protein